MTQQKQDDKFKQLVEMTALDWLPIVFNASTFPHNERPTPEQQREIEVQIAELQGTLLEKLVLNFRKTLEEEERRRAQIESKANNLLGFTAIALSFIVGFAQFLLGGGTLPRLLLWITVTLYVLIALSLLVTIVLARRAVTIAAFQKPMPAEYLKLRKSDYDAFYRRLAASLLQSYENNQAVVNDKTTYVIGAQDWFRNTLILLVTLVITMAVGIVTVRSTQAEVQPIRMVILTPTSTPTLTTKETPVPTLSATVSPLASPTVKKPATQAP